MLGHRPPLRLPHERLSCTDFLFVLPLLEAAGEALKIGGGGTPPRRRSRGRGWPTREGDFRREARSAPRSRLSPQPSPPHFTQLLFTADRREEN